MKTFIEDFASSLYVVVTDLHCTTSFLFLTKIQIGDTSWDTYTRQQQNPQDCIWISILSINLTFPNHAATQMTTGRSIVSTDTKLSWSTICVGITDSFNTNQKFIMISKNMLPEKLRCPTWFYSFYQNQRYAVLRNKIANYAELGCLVLQTIQVYHADFKGSPGNNQHQCYNKNGP